MISKKLWLVIIGITVVASLGVYLDIYLSFMAYNANPEIFIQYEMTQEAIDWFTEGKIPFWTMLSLCAFPFCAFYIVYKWEKYKDIKFSTIYGASIVGFIYFLFFTRLAAGLTWFLSTYYMSRFFQLITMCFFAVICYFIFVHFPKEANTFPFNLRRQKNDSKTKINF